MTVPSLLVTNAGCLHTCASDGGPLLRSNLGDLVPLADGAVAVNGGEILAVGSSEDILAEYPPGPETIVLDARGKTVTPGFVDCHTHLVFAGTREREWIAKLQGATYLDILNAGGGILSTVRATRDASASELLEIGRATLRKMRSLGTTTVEMKTGYGLDLDCEWKILEVSRQLAREFDLEPHLTFLGAHAVPVEYRGRADAYVEVVVREMLPEFHGDVSACDIFCDRGAFTLAQSERVLNAAAAMGYDIKAHAGEFADLGAAELVAGLDGLSVDHADHLSVAAIDLMAERGTAAVLLPGVNFFLDTRPLAPCRELIERGVPVALATDYNPGSCPCLSMPLIMSLACRMYGMTPSEALAASTINAAYALRAHDRTGSLEPGKRADLLILDAPHFDAVPYHFGDNLVRTVVQGGRVVHTASDT